MISLSGVVMVVIYLLVAAAIFGLLFWLVGYVGAMLPGDAGQLFIKAARIFLAVCVVLILIFLLLSFVNGQPVFRP